MQINQFQSYFIQKLKNLTNKKLYLMLLESARKAEYFTQILYLQLQSYDQESCLKILNRNSGYVWTENPGVFLQQNMWP